MSVHATTWGWEQPVKNSTHRLVLVAVCDNAAGPDAEVPGLCWPSIKSIAKRCMISERHAKDIISELTESGLLVKTRRRRRADGTLSVWEYVVPYTRGTPVHLDTPDQGNPSAEPGEPQCVNQGNPSSPHEPSGEPSGEPSPPVVPHGGTIETIVGCNVSIPVNAGESFSMWYASYPRKQGRAAALKSWMRVPQAERIACIQAQAAWNAHFTERNEPEFIPMASTWINQRRWQDEIPTFARRATTRHGQQMQVYDEFLQRHANDPQPERTPLSLPKGNP